MTDADVTWFILREPGKVPQLKKSLTRDTKAFLRELMEHRPTAFITVLSIMDGHPIVHDGPELLEMIDGRMRATAARHRASTDAAFGRWNRDRPVP